MSSLEPIFCEHEGEVLHGQIAVPSGTGPFPAVMIVHSAYGLGSQMQSIALRLAGEGYIALAIDMYGQGAYSEDSREISELVKRLWGNAVRQRSRMKVWHQRLKAINNVDIGRIAAIGYCFGGQCVLEFARDGADVKAVVSFHGILSTNLPAESKAVRAHVVVYTGARDPHAPRQQVEALRQELSEAGASWQISEFGNALHAFTEPRADTPDAGRAYEPLADRVSWASTLALLDAVFNDVIIL